MVFYPPSSPHSTPFPLPSPIQESAASVDDTTSTTQIVWRIVLFRFDQARALTADGKKRRKKNHKQTIEVTLFHSAKSESMYTSGKHCAWHHTWHRAALLGKSSTLLMTSLANMFLFPLSTQRQITSGFREGGLLKKEKCHFIFNLFII